MPPLLSEGLRKIYGEQIDELMVEFSSDHLPPPLKEVADQFTGPALFVKNQTPLPSGEKLRALEHLRMARDAAVRDVKNHIQETETHLSKDK